MRRIFLGIILAPYLYFVCNTVQWHCNERWQQASLLSSIKNQERTLENGGTKVIPLKSCLPKKQVCKVKPARLQDKCVC